MENEKLNRTADETKQDGKGKRIKKTTIVLIIVAVAAVYIALSMFFMGHYYFGTTINEVACGGEKSDTVKDEIARRVDSYMLTLEEREGKSETITGSDIGLQADFDNNTEVDDILKSQAAFAWPVGIFMNKDYTTDTVVKYSGLDTVVAGLECADPTKFLGQSDAHLSDYIEGKGFEVIDENPGTELQSPHPTLAASAESYADHKVH